ncbi:hypothetical protein BH11ARM2_BH11ARM2_14930 [soil metagenome]
MHDLFSVIPLLIPIMIFAIPIIAILSTHQRKMAEVLRSGHQDASVDALRREVAELKILVHQQSISIDNLVSMQTRPVSDVRERVSL